MTPLAPTAPTALAGGTAPAPARATTEASA